MKATEQSKLSNMAGTTVCFCRQIDRQTIFHAINHGAKSLEAIATATGAGTECGCCQVYIKELLGEKQWLSVRLASVHRYSENYCAFRFARTDGNAWNREKPGAYFIFQTQIDGAWVGRPYAITDDGAESGFREITIKRKSGGFFSSWLFDHLDTLEKQSLRISASVGGSIFNPDSSKPIICLIAGVGITPVLALCRMLTEKNSQSEIYIDYSARNEEDFFCRDELMQVAERCNLTISFRKTASAGHIKQHDVDTIIQQYPGENFYVCGSDSYKTTVIEMLHNREIAPRQIFDLEASHTKAEIAATHEQAVDIEVTWGYRVVGLLLLIAYCLQDAFALKLAPLEQLQSDLNYKILSGLLLLIYILTQWRLPIVRWLKLDNKALMEKKHSHKYFGAIAPLMLYLHATNFGYAYLTVLSSVYLVNSLLGYCSGEFIANAYKKAYSFGWTVMHIGLSTSLLFLSVYHVYIALAYK